MLYLAELAVICCTLLLNIGVGEGLPQQGDIKDSPIQLAFGIMTYQKRGQTVEQVMSSFTTLMDSIYSTENHLYILHVDSKSDKQLLHAIYKEFCDSSQRVHNCGYIRPRNVGWGGPTVSEMNLALMQAAVEYPALQYVKHPQRQGQKQGHIETRHTLERPWDYFILLGHESVPLVSLQYIEQFLGSVKHGKLFPPSTNPSPSHVPVPLSVYPTDTNFINCWHSYGHDFYGQWEDVITRLETVIVDSHKGYLMENLYWRDNKNNKYHELRRPLLHDGVKNVNGLDDTDADAVAEIDIFKSIQYVGLTMDACRHILYGPETRRILLYLANVKASDELIMPTIFMHGNQTLASTATCDNTLHFMHWIRPGGSWHPEYLTMEHLPLIMNTTKHLFIRKVNEESAMLLLALEELRSLCWDDMSTNVSPGQSSSTSDSNSDSAAMSDDISHSGQFKVHKRNDGREYRVHTPKAVHDSLVPPLQRSLLLYNLSPSFTHRCIEHIILEATLQGIPTSIVIQEAAAGVQYTAEDRLNLMPQGSIAVKATSIVMSFFPQFSWVEVKATKTDVETVEKAGNGELDDNIDIDIDADMDIDRFSLLWHRGLVSYDHISVSSALHFLNELRIHRDAIEERKFIKYWTDKQQRQREAQEQEHV